jgi:anti-sigma factor RsiW
MKEEAATDALLRQFLLGRVEDEERQRLESLFITDSQMKDRVLAAEQELIDDYLEDCLSTADREAFLSFYGDTADQRRKLEIARSIQEWAANQPGTTAIVPKPALSVWDRLRGRLLLKPIFIIPIAATAAVAIVFALVWVNNRRTERDRQYLAVQQELAQLNTPSSLREVPAQMVHLTLKPTVIRGIDSQPELPSRSNVRIVELRLLWMQSEDYASYQALVRRSGDDQSYTIDNVTIEGSKVIRIRLPARILIRGNNQIELTGVAADGSKSPPEIYSFTVSE